VESILYVHGIIRARTASLQLDNEVLQSTDQPHGTIWHQHSTVTGPVGNRIQSGTEDAAVLDRPAPLRRLHGSGAGYLLTYLLIQRCTCCEYD